MTQRARDAVRAILHQDLGEQPTGATVRRFRELEEAALELPDLDADERHHCNTIRSYLRPTEGVNDRDIGARVRKERRWHLVTMAVAGLVRAVYRRPE